MILNIDLNYSNSREPAHPKLSLDFNIYLKVLWNYHNGMPCKLQWTQWNLFVSLSKPGFEKILGSDGKAKCEIICKDINKLITKLIFLNNNCMAFSAFKSKHYPENACKNSVNIFSFLFIGECVFHSTFSLRHMHMRAYTEDRFWSKISRFNWENCRLRLIDFEIEWESVSI